ncbi:MAG: hypothetical protein HOW73_34945 [Polyangiaceae bacterium]|nr:hypothetical protein [Polyangiaceae bacterium]
MADLYSKVTLRPRSKLERIIELLQRATSVPKRPDSTVVVQLVLYYLVSAEVSPSDASRLVKSFHDDLARIDPARLVEVEAESVREACPERHLGDLVSALRATGLAAREGLEELSRRDIDEAKRRIAQLPRMNAESVDLILLSCGVASTVAPSAPARRVACRIGYPGTTYAALARALDAEIPEGDATDLAWRAHHVLAQHGRDICQLPRPQCDRCAVRASCSYHGEGDDPASRLSNPGIAG